MSEKVGEVALIRESRREGDLRQRQIGLAQLESGSFDPEIPDVLSYRAAERLPERSG
jgi:hypothetical protein